jgi:hypothetical protein
MFHLPNARARLKWRGSFVFWLYKPVVLSLSFCLRLMSSSVDKYFRAAISCRYCIFLLSVKLVFYVNHQNIYSFVNSILECLTLLVNKPLC